jgi:hypothetical protein
VEEPAVERLEKRLADTVGSLFDLLDEVSNQISNCKNAKEFRAFREDAFPSYFSLMSSLGSIFNAKVAARDFPALIESSFVALEAEFLSKESQSYFGEDAYREIQFCLSTYKGACRWLPFIMANRPAEDLRAGDRELASNYQISATWTHFHLAGLGMALIKLQPVASDVLQELLDGLRHAVMVYAYIRQALDLRKVLAERYNEELTVTWDAEDRALARAD